MGTARLPDDVAQNVYAKGEEGVHLHRRTISVSLGAAVSSILAIGSTLEGAAATSEGDQKTRQGGATTDKGSKKANVFELEGGIKALDVRIGTGPNPKEGDKIAIHYYGRLGAKQGWRFDSSYEHKDLFGVPEPYVFTIGSGQVIAGIDTAVRSMRVGGIRRVVIPPDQGYQNKEQGPVPPDFFDRQRLYTTIFNPTRLANGEGATLGTVIFDLELVRIQS
ncbi:FKBP-type peptidyl-prolyl cis-trans isomerase family protein [Klebsormidium nitens]|uniref:peptidylprolyl isomerase n=1 Tax=Klebsormidium nitens TaxID=105231 RepID=A0A0U9HM18_KLENI|nr:FKBP-type peptidyl-prolyl cis-trans isomerase family protein [Klebsormidium nitens]|eukprot:GAQ85995.1 FKBP-type peptidyl-prolyl cis-trans isomerase family protein [Klebsormidium nitens]